MMKEYGCYLLHHSLSLHYLRVIACATIMCMIAHHGRRGPQNTLLAACGPRVEYLCILVSAHSRGRFQDNSSDDRR